MTLNTRCHIKLLHMIMHVANYDKRTVKISICIVNLNTYAISNKSFARRSVRKQKTKNKTTTEKHKQTHIKCKSIERYSKWKSRFEYVAYILHERAVSEYRAKREWQKPYEFRRHPLVRVWSSVK